MLARPPVERKGALGYGSYEDTMATLEKALTPGPFLTGDRFTAADLTFAALAAAVLVPPEYGVALPQPDVLPEPVASAVRSMREHPAGVFALRLFREERRVAAD